MLRPIALFGRAGTDRPAPVERVDMQEGVLELRIRAEGLASLVGSRVSAASRRRGQRYAELSGASMLHSVRSVWR